MVRYISLSGRREIDALQKSLQEKTDEVRQLQKQLADVDHANHTEMVKLRLEVMGNEKKIVLDHFFS